MQSSLERAHVSSNFGQMVSALYHSLLNEDMALQIRTSEHIANGSKPNGACTQILNHFTQRQTVLRMLKGWMKTIKRKRKW